MTFWVFKTLKMLILIEKSSIKFETSGSKVQIRRRPIGVALALQRWLWQVLRSRVFLVGFEIHKQIRVRL